MSFDRRYPHQITTLLYIMAKFFFGEVMKELAHKEPLTQRGKKIRIKTSELVLLFT